MHLQQLIQEKRTIIQAIQLKHSAHIQHTEEDSEQDMQAGTGIQAGTGMQAGRVEQPRGKKLLVEQPGRKRSASSGIGSKNQLVNETDAMLFDKKFKNYLNHKKEFQEQARLRRVRIMSTRKQPQPPAEPDYFNAEEVLCNQDSDCLYHDASDMKAAYTQIVSGKKRKTGQQLKLYHVELFENTFRREQFAKLAMSAATVTKQALRLYLFDQPAIMMLYSVSPFTLGDELAEFESADNSALAYEEFSAFLLADRQPTCISYRQEVIEEARRIGRGIKCAPIKGKWIDETGLFEKLESTFNELDLHGDGKVERVFLAKKLRRDAESSQTIQSEVVEIVNIARRLPLDRLLYEIEFELRPDGKEDWTREEFLAYLRDYHRLATPEKDRLLTKLILTGKYDSSYVFIVSEEVLAILKQVFHALPKFAEYFVVKAKFIEAFTRDPRYPRLKQLLVRAEANRYVHKETVEETLVRMNAQTAFYCDIEEILDFFTNRGRPKLVEHQVYLENLQRQLDIIEAEEQAEQAKYRNGEQSSDDEQFQTSVREKAIGRKKDKLKAIRDTNQFAHEKKFNVTIPVGFDCDNRPKKPTIREQKVKEMLEEKRLQEEALMQPFVSSEVPAHVKDKHLYAKLVKDQERERADRLERFRLEITNSQGKVSDRLTQPKTLDIHCEFGREEYKFVARPMPWYCEVNLLERINRQKQERRENILEQIIDKHSEFDLPEGVKNMIDRQQQLQLKNKAKSTESTNTHLTFIPTITQKVPDFKTIHQHLHFELENAKEAREPIQVEPFSFENRPARSKTVQQQPAKKEQPRVCETKRENMQAPEIPSTEKFDALVKLRKKQQQERVSNEMKEEKSAVSRKMMRDRFAPLVMKALKKSHYEPSKSRTLIEHKIKELRREDEKKKAEYQDEMIKIYAKVLSRPMLVEGASLQDSKTNSRQHPSRKHKSPQADGQPEAYQQGHSRRHEDYEQERRRAVEQHQPGQYLMEDDEPGQQRAHLNDEDEYSSEGHYTN